MAEMDQIRLGSRVEEVLAAIDGNFTALNQSKAEVDALPTKLSQLTNDGNFVSDGAYVHTDQNFTQEEKTKLAGLVNYTLPVAGEQLGGVKNGGNVTVNADGTMTAPAGADTGVTVQKLTFTAQDSRWSQAEGGGWQLTVLASGASTAAVYQKVGTQLCQVLCGVAIEETQVLLTAQEAFEGCLVLL